VDMTLYHPEIPLSEVKQHCHHNNANSLSGLQWDMLIHVSQVFEKMERKVANNSRYIGFFIC